MSLNRIRRMSSQEIGHRLRERVRQAADRIRFRSGMLAENDREFDTLIAGHGSSLKSYLQDRARPRFYPSTHDPDAAAEFISRRFPEWSTRAFCDAELLGEHRISVLGYSDMTLGSDIDWHRDPVSGYRWPRKFWTEFDLVKSPPADAKVIHELNRHQHLPRLAKAFFLTGDESYAREAIAQMESWIDQNPRWNGINWQSSLEIGIRTTSWLWAIFLLLRSEALAEAKLQRIVKSLFAQLDQIYRYPSVYSSPNTHLIGEATALFTAGIVFHELPRAEQWRTFAMKTLIEEMERQVCPDGVYCELSSYYHCYATDFYVHVLALARWNRIELPERMCTRLAGMLDFVLHLTRPDGTIPLLGDDDGGRVTMLSLEDYRSYQDGLCSGAVLFGRGDFKHQAPQFQENTFWLMGADAWPIFESLTAEAPSEESKAFGNAGYFVQRSGWNAADTHLVFDSGGLGLPSGGHGHADALSFTLFTGGHDFLIDPGTAVYNGAPEWREYFRSSQAHNTVVVDGLSQSETSGTFTWKKKAPVAVRRHFSLQDIDYVEGEHGGYAQNPRGVIHRRRFIYIRPNYWILLDDLHGNGKHDFDFFYHFAPDARLTIFGEEKSGDLDCRARIGNAGLQVLLYGSGPLRASVECGQQHPIQGWSSEKYGERHPSSVLRASIRGDAPVSMMTFLLPGNHAAESRRLQTNSNHTIAAVIRDGEFDDVAVTATADGDLHCFDCVMCGDFFWMRMVNGNLARLLAVNARFFKYGSETVFESKKPVPYVQAYFWENGIVIEHGGENEGRVYVRDLRDRQFQRH